MTQKRMTEMKFQMKNSKRMIINMLKQLKNIPSIFKKDINRHQKERRMSINDMKIEFSQAVMKAFNPST